MMMNKKDLLSILGMGRQYSPNEINGVKTVCLQKFHWKMKNITRKLTSDLMAPLHQRKTMKTSLRQIDGRGEDVVKMKQFRGRGQNETISGLQVHTRSSPRPCYFHTASLLGSYYVHRVSTRFLLRGHHAHPVFIRSYRVVTTTKQTAPRAYRVFSTFLLYIYTQLSIQCLFV